jgi:hypothetical protein
MRAGPETILLKEQPEISIIPNHKRPLWASIIVRHPLSDPMLPISPTALSAKPMPLRRRL